MIGILYSGVEQLPQDQMPNKHLLRSWAAHAQAIENLNEKMDARSLQSLKGLAKNGLQATLLKGQGLARLYGPLASKRHSGDIDVFVDGGVLNALQKVRPVLGDWGYKHAELKIWKNTEVELHYRVEFICSILKNNRLQKWFAAHNEELFHHDGEWVTPTLEMNLFYILLHIYRHFFYQGIGMRQIIDYYFILRQLKLSDNPQLSVFNTKLPVKEAVKSFGMEHFADGLMWAMGEALAMPRDWMPWTPDEQEGRFILSQIMTDGNFCHDNHKRLKKWIRTTRHNIHLLRHYPIEVLSTPLWMVYQRLWNLAYHLKFKKIQTSINQ